MKFIRPYFIFAAVVTAVSVFASGFLTAGEVTSQITKGTEILTVRDAAEASGIFSEPLKGEKGSPFENFDKEKLLLLLPPPLCGIYDLSLSAYAFAEDIAEKL